MQGLDGGRRSWRPAGAIVARHGGLQAAGSAKQPQMSSRQHQWQIYSASEAAGGGGGSSGGTGGGGGGGGGGGDDGDDEEEDEILTAAQVSSIACDINGGRLCVRSALWTARILWPPPTHPPMRQNVHNQAEAAAAAAKVQLPADMVETARQVGLRSSAFSKYVALQGLGLAGTLARRFPAVRDRLIADDKFLFKVIIEIFIDAGRHGKEGGWGPQLQG